MKFAIRNLLFCSHLILGVSGAATASPWADVQRFLKERVVDGEPGFAVLVASKGNPKFSMASGLANVDSEEPITLDTPFYVASVGKAITATATMSLVESGALSLEDTVGQHLQWAPEYLRPVTLHQLLTHTAGVRDYPDELAGYTECLSNEHIKFWLLGQRILDFEPGTAFSYSNSGFVLLAEIVEAAAGKGFEDVIAERVFGPAGMKRSAVVGARFNIPSGSALGYSRNENEGWRSNGYDQCTEGPGGVYASANDLLAFDRALTENRLLSRETKSSMFTPASIDDGSLTPFSPGWISGTVTRGPLKGQEARQVLGNLNGFAAAFRRFPAPDVTIIWLSNRGEPLFDAGIEDAAAAAGLFERPRPE